MWAGSSGAVCNIVPELNILVLPYMFMQNSDVDKVLDKIDKEVDSIMNRYGIKLYYFSELGWRNIATLSKGVASMADLKGMRVRTQENDIYIGMWKAFGAEPLPISVTELLTALQTKIVEGMDSSPMVFMSMGWYSTAKYYTLSRHIYQPAIMIINNNFYASLSDNYKKIIMESRQDLPQNVRLEIRSLENQLFKTFRESGIEIIKMSEKEREKLKQATKHLHKIFLSGTSAEGKKLYNKIKSILKKQ